VRRGELNAGWSRCTAPDVRLPSGVGLAAGKSTLGKGERGQRPTLWHPARAQQSAVYCGREQLIGRRNVSAACSVWNDASDAPHEPREWLEATCSLADAHSHWQTTQRWTGAWPGSNAKSKCLSHAPAWVAETGRGAGRSLAVLTTFAHYIGRRRRLHSHTAPRNVHGRRHLLCGRDCANGKLVSVHHHVHADDALRTAVWSLVLPICRANTPPPSAATNPLVHIPIYLIRKPEPQRSGRPS
jgi:hypothetical protein